jgi:hypothetical protein
MEIKTPFPVLINYLFDPNKRRSTYFDFIKRDKDRDKFYIGDKRGRRQGHDFHMPLLKPAMPIYSALDRFLATSFGFSKASLWLCRCTSMLYLCNLSARKLGYEFSNT